jgi:competence protein ComEC
MTMSASNRIRLSASLRFAIALLLVLACISTGFCASGKLTVSVIDVGQGDSILVEFPDGQDMLVDAGDRTHGQTVVNYLRSRMISQIDILVATHPHADHIGGMPAVLSAFKIGKVWDSGYNHGSQTQKTFLSTIRNKGIRFGMPKAGFSEQIGSARVSVLAPKTLIPGEANNNSIVLRVTDNKISFLLMGDAEEEERATIGSWPKSTVLKVSHHGSRNGTDAAFLRSVAPKIAVISVAASNSYGHPHAETMALLRNAGVKTYLTSVEGTVVLTSDGNTVTERSLGASHASACTMYGGSSRSSTKSAPVQAGGCRYIGNRNTHFFHSPSCSYLPAPKNRVCFSSREEAIRQGYRPCKKCNP